VRQSSGPVYALTTTEPAIVPVHAVLWLDEERPLTWEQRLGYPHPHRARETRIDSAARAWSQGSNQQEQTSERTQSVHHV
jgi:hypothetical protein